MKISEAAKKAGVRCSELGFFTEEFYRRMTADRYAEIIQSEIDGMQEQHDRELNQVRRQRDLARMAADQNEIARAATEREARAYKDQGLEGQRRIKELERKLEHKDAAMDSYAAYIRRLRLELADKENQLQEVRHSENFSEVVKLHAQMTRLENRFRE